jgi:hypothetical protein
MSKKHNPLFDERRVCNHINTNNGNVHFTNFLDSTGATPATDENPENPEDQEFHNLKPLPHQDQLKDPFDQDFSYTLESSVHSVMTNKEGTPDKDLNIMEKQVYVVPQSLRKPFQSPLVARL